MNTLTRSNAFRATLIGSAAWGVIFSPVFAQTATSAPAITPPPAAQQLPSPRSSGLTDIVVTARRRVENLQNIPVADTVVSAKTLNNFAITSVEGLSNLAPQLVVGRTGTGNGASIALRGISVNSTSISLQQSVAVVIDGVYYSGGRVLDEGLFDLDRAEVLKGPQSLFYGKNTTAGAISFTSADPTPTFQAMARGGYEFEAENPYLEGWVSGPLTDKLSFRVAGYYSKQFGGLFTNETAPITTYTKDYATGILTAHPVAQAPSDIGMDQTGTTRLTLQYDATNNLVLKLKVNYNNFSTDTPNLNTVIASCNNGIVQSDATAPCGKKFVIAQQRLPADIAASNPLFSVDGGNPYMHYESFNTTFSLAYTADNFTFTLLPAFTTYVNRWRGDFDFTNSYSLPGATGASGGNGTGTKETSDAISTEARLQSKLNFPINFMAGVYVQTSQLYFVQPAIFPGGPENSAAPAGDRYLTLNKDSHTFDDTYAIFGEALWDITNNLNLTVGARYTVESNDSSFSQTYVLPTATTYCKCTIGANQTFHNVSPDATLTWKPTRLVTVYGSYRTGYKSGGFSISGLITPATTDADATFKPETVTGYEGGIKSTLFDNQLRLNADVFDYLYKNLQVDFFDATLVQYLDLNAGAARTEGAELEAEFAPRAIPDLDIRASVSYDDAYYVSFPYAPCVAGQTPIGGCNRGVTPSGTRNFQNLTGEATQQAPRWTGTIGADYTHAINEKWKVGLSVNVRMSDRYSTNPFADSAALRFFQNSYATLDANLRLFSLGDKWELALIGKNLTNQFIKTEAFDLSYTGSGTGTAAGIPAAVRASVADPRTVAIQLTHRF